MSKQWRDRGGAKKSCVKILLLGIVGNWWIRTEYGSGLGVTWVGAKALGGSSIPTTPAIV